MTKVLIGIQARSTSSRLPGKALMQLHNKPILNWVLNACCDSANYIDKKTYGRISLEVAVLCPENDHIVEAFRNSQVAIIEGDEQDVLSRYVDAARICGADYVARITGDCPLVTGFLITSHIFKAVNHGFDYISNVDEAVRTEMDGRDIEVMSADALRWLDHNATSDADREHVTTAIRREKPSHLRRGHYLNRLDMSDLKISIDTDDDLNQVENRVRSFFNKRSIAERDVGPTNVFYC